MADLSITATDVKVASPFFIQAQGGRPVAEALNAGEVVRLDPSTGKITPANASSVAESWAILGVAVRTAESTGIAPTVMQYGYLDVGNALSALNVGDLIYVSDTDGAMATTSGTVRRVIGRVVSAFGVSTTADKLIEVNCLGDFAYGQGRTVRVGVPLETIREITTGAVINAAGNGGILASDTTPILNTINGDTDGQLRLAWAASNVDAIGFQVVVPADYDEASDVTIYVRAYMAGSTDTPTIASDVYFNEGDTKVEDASAAVTGTTPVNYAITIAAADVPAGASVMSVELTPGAHGTDILYVTGVWVDFKSAGV